VVKKTDREIVQQIDQAFAALIVSLKDLAGSVPPDQYILRSAAAIEQMCGGLTANLWDDPFEWTLPETLSNADRLSSICRKSILRVSVRSTRSTMPP
jgi:hypothetical protein